MGAKGFPRELFLGSRKGLSLTRGSGQLVLLGHLLEARARSETGQAIRSLIGATVTQAGAFLMRAGRVGAETMLARIVPIVAES